MLLGLKSKGERLMKILSLTLSILLVISYLATASADETSSLASSSSAPSSSVSSSSSISSSDDSNFGRDLKGEILSSLNHAQKIVISSTTGIFGYKKGIGISYNNGRNSEYPFIRGWTCLSLDDEVDQSLKSREERLDKTENNKYFKMYYKDFDDQDGSILNLIDTFLSASPITENAHLCDRSGRKIEISKTSNRNYEIQFIENEKILKYGKGKDPKEAMWNLQDL